jgi:glycosyltransferase involved in cell wall biosynthesis
VALATRNGEAFLEEQLESLACQSRLPDELLISDDESNDSTRKIAVDFAARAPFTVVVHANKTRLGYARNFMTTAQRCAGDLILFCDQDDIWLPEKLETMARVAAESGGSVISHDLEVFFDRGNGEPVASYYRHLRKKGFPPAVCFKGCSLGVTRAFIEHWGLPPESTDITHDFWTALLATGLQERIYVEQVLVRHRMHSTNASGWFASNKDRARFHAGSTPSPSDFELMVDLCLKPWNLSWIDALLSVLERRGNSQELVTPLLKTLHDQLEWYDRGQE